MKASLARTALFLVMLSISGLAVLSTQGSVHASELPQANLPQRQESINEPAKFVSSKKVSSYILQDTYISSRDASDKSVVLTMDLSDAIFYDDDNNVVNKDTVMRTIVPAQEIKGASTSGGSWQSGSGYAVCKGMRVSASALGVVNAYYNVDFTHVQSGADHLDRVYGAGVTGVGNWTWLNNGIMRRTESGSLSAYGGIKGQWSGLGATHTSYCWFRVGGDKYWLDSNF